MTTKKKTTKKKTNSSPKLPPTKQKKKLNQELILKYGQIFLHFIVTFFVTLRKVSLNCVKKIKKRKRKQYNTVRQRTDYSKEKSNTLKDKEEQTPVLLSYQGIKGIKKIPIFFKNRIKVMKYDMKKFKKKFKYGTLKDKLLIIFMIGLISIISIGICFCGFIILNAPEVNEERLYKNNSTILLDAEGNEFARLGLENREKLTYDELPEVLIDAIVATEDSRFFQHNGIDLARFIKASFGQILGNSNAGGGSTLTMQVSKNAATNRNAHGLAGIIRKFTDIYLSVFVLEKQYTKEQIMEFYVNIPDLGARAFGVEQASQIYFGKSASDLNLAEAAMIAGLFQAPTAFNPYAHPVAAENRRNIVLNLMYRHGYISEQERDAAKAVPVKSLLVGQKSSVNIYQDFIDTLHYDVINKTGDNPNYESMIIHTTLMPKKQDVVDKIMREGVKNFRWKNDKAQAGIAVIDVDTGAIVAVGASRDEAALVTNFATEVPRQPGSTAKPILDYGPAIEYLNWGTGQTIIDEKYSYSSGTSIKNWDNKFKGVMTIKTALAQSRNIPALFAFQQTTNEQKAEFAANLGWSPETNGNGTILESCSIGGFDGVTPVQSAAAFATFARGGTYIEPFTFTKIEYVDTGEVYENKPKKVVAMSEETAYLINVILKYAVTSGQIGTGSISGTDIAAKTGTSTIDASAKKAYGIKANIIGDSWEVAYSPDYAISTWYGYEPRISKDYYLTGTEGGNARKEFTKALVKGIMEKNSRFKKPKGIVSAEIELETDPVQLASAHTPKELRSTEYFKKGAAPTDVSSRFDTLANPSNLKYSSTASSVTLSWDATPTPKAIDQNYLTEYFNNSKIYKPWANNYLNKRISYNNSTFGSFGYRVYLKNAYGTQDLGFTTNTTFTTNVQFDATTTFIVKSSYQKFTANQSTGISVAVAPNSQSNNNVPSTTNPSQSTTAAASNLNIYYLGPQCSTVDDYKALGSNPRDKIKVVADGQDVTSSANITAECCLADNLDSCGHCSNLVSGTKYSITFTVKYQKLERNKIVTLSSSC